MKKLIAGLAASAFLMGATPVMANETYLTPNAPFVFNGNLQVSKGLNLNCAFTLTVNGPNNASDTTPAFNHTDLDQTTATIAVSGGFLSPCNLITVNPVTVGNISYAASSTTAGTFTLSGIYVNTPTPGDCAGTLTGAWNQTAKTLVVSASLPAVSAGSACSISGTLSLSSPSTGDVVSHTDSDHNANHQNN